MFVSVLGGGGGRFACVLGGGGYRFACVFGVGWEGGGGGGRGAVEGAERIVTVFGAVCLTIIINSDLVIHTGCWRSYGCGKPVFSRVSREP